MARPICMFTLLAPRYSGRAFIYCERSEPNRNPVGMT